MMSKREKRELEQRMLDMLGDKCVVGYYDRPLTVRGGASTLGRPNVTVKVPDSSRKIGLGER